MHSLISRTQFSSSCHVSTAFFHRRKMLLQLLLVLVGRARLLPVHNRAAPLQLRMGGAGTRGNGKSEEVKKF